jgi:DNA mismatch repair protein MutL
MLHYLLDGRTGELQPVARSQGTTVEVKELFYSTPARRKFLKTDATELAHCIEAVRRHALARPDVGFAIWHEGKLVEQWRRCSPGAEAPMAAFAAMAALDQRLADVLGSDFMAQSIAVQWTAAGVARRGNAQGESSQAPRTRTLRQRRKRCPPCVEGLGPCGHSRRGTRAPTSSFAT